MTASSREYLLHAARVLVPDATVFDGVVQISGERIERIGARSDFAVEPDLPLHELGEVTLIPGLIDAHAHLTFPGDGTGYGEIMDMSQAASEGIVVRNARLHLRAGVTTVRDNGAAGRLGFLLHRFLERAGVPIRVHASGPPVTPFRGHLWWCGGEADGPDAVRAKVDELVAQGADHIKVMASGGGTPGTVQWSATYDETTLTALVGRAAELSRDVVAHTHATEAVARSTRAGVRVLEHASFIDPPAEGERPRQVGAAWTGLSSTFDPAVAQLIADNGSFVGATLQGGLARLQRLERLLDERELSEDEQAQYLASRQHLDRKLRIVQQLVDYGLVERIAISSDAGPADTEFGRLHEAVALAVDAGMSPRKAIDAVTITAARAMRIDDRLGAIRSGALADLVVVQGDPTGDLRRLSDIQAVYIGGRPVHEAVEPSSRENLP